MTRIREAAAWTAGALLCLWVLASNVSPAFTPVRGELGDARGFSRGLLNFVVLARDRAFLHAPRWPFAAVVAAFLLAAVCVPSRRTRGTMVCVGMGAALFLATALSAYASAYRIVLTPRTFVLGVLLIAAPALAALVSQARAHLRDMNAVTRRRTAIVACGLLGAAFFTSAMIQTLAGYDGNYSGFLHISRRVAARAPDLADRPAVERTLVLSDEGYDGQFMYLIAFDPFLQRHAREPREYRAYIDNPPYRYGRIAFPLLTRALSAGQPERFPVVMMWLIVFAHVVLAASLASIASRHGWPPLSALLYLAIPGFLSSLLSALPESLAAATLVAGFACWERKRIGWAALLLACALLVRETGIVLVLALVMTSASREGKRTALVLATSLAPLAAWRLFVALRLYSDWGWRAIITSPGDLGIPFAGLGHLVGSGTVLFPLLVTTAFVLALALVRERFGPLEIAAVVYGLVAVSLRFDQIWSHLPSGERGTFELFLCLLLILFEGRGAVSWPRRTLAGLFVALALYTLAFAPDAATARAALLVIR